MKNISIRQIVAAGLLTGIGILVGAFAHFTFIGQIYLVGLIVFLYPLMLRLDLAIISTIITVTIVDVIAGWGANTWISAIVYSVAVVVIWLFSKLQFKVAYNFGVLIAASVVIAGYYFLELSIYDKALAIKDVVGTSIEMAIVVPAVSLLYWPMKIVSATLK